jgi:lysophospholipase L1-like esterase
MSVMRGRLLVAAWGSALALGVWHAIVGLLPEVDAGRWAALRPPMPPMSESLAGPLEPSSAALDLAFRQGVSPRVPRFHDGRLRLRAQVPEGGQLEIAFGENLQIVRPGELQRPTGGVPAGILVDRGPRGGIRGIGLTCEPMTTPPERFDLALELRDRQVLVDVGGQVARCEGPWARGDLLLQAGVARVRIEWIELEPDGVPALSEDFGRFPRRLLHGLLLSLLAGLALGFGLPSVSASPSWKRDLPRGLALAGLPLLLVPLGLCVDASASLEALRLLDTPPSLAPLLLFGGPGLVSLLIGLAARPGRLPPLIAALLPPLLAALGLLGVGWPVDSVGLILLASLSAPLALTVVLNTRPLRFHGILSLLSFGLLIGQAELGLRHTAQDRNWAPSEGWRRAREEFRELLEIRRHRAYPDQGFPVRPPDPEPGRPRIVALGGSSTGGAFQMDDIRLFWPQKLEDRLADRGWRVVNQGVGGWNTLHVRLYVESQIERLDPRILALYVGHNDLLTRTAFPYRELWRRYEAEGAVSGRPNPLTLLLDRSRLGMGFRFGVLALRAREQAVAVPVDDARENLAALIDLAEARGARVLLMTEGLHPDPAPMRPYDAMLSQLAAERGALHLDAATVLHEADARDLFLDDCHLSEAGHAFLATRVEASLEEAGWLR